MLFLLLCKRVLPSVARVKFFYKFKQIVFYFSTVLMKFLSNYLPNIKIMIGPQSEQQLIGFLCFNMNDQANNWEGSFMSNKLLALKQKLHQNRSRRHHL